MLELRRSALLWVVPNSVETREGGDGTQRGRRPERGKMHRSRMERMEPERRRSLKFHREFKMDDH